MPFVHQTEVGTMGAPFEFHCGTVELCVNFGAGYTWYSVNVNPGSMSLNSLFGNLTPCENDRIIGQTSFATYYGTQWVGSLSTINPAAMYKMKLCSQQTWCKQGIPVTNSPITVPSGYPWIGYLPQSDLPINTAIANISPAPTVNDRFNGQSSFATYSGTTWVGPLATLQRGKGYIVHLANASVLTYPAAVSKSASTIVETEPVNISPTGDNASPTLRYTMQMIAKVILPDGSISTNEGDAVYAYVGNECRGMAIPVPDLDGKLFLSVGSDMETGEEVSFKVYLSDDNRLYDVKNSIVFSSEMETGTMTEPYEFNLMGFTGTTLETKALGIKVGDIYPNPFDETASLELIIDKPGRLEGKIINRLGQVMQLVIDQDLIIGTHIIKLNATILPPGLYSLMMNYTSNQGKLVITRKMIVK